MVHFCIIHFWNLVL